MCAKCSLYLFTPQRCHFQSVPRAFKVRSSGRVARGEKVVCEASGRKGKRIRARFGQGIGHRLLGLGTFDGIPHQQDELDVRGTSE